jgi:hypothetical protein
MDEITALQAPRAPGIEPTWTSSDKDLVGCALGFIACNGLASDQDRWEEDAGVNTFTWPQSDGAWRGQDFTVAVSNPAAHTTPDGIQREIDNTQSSAVAGMDTNV